MCGIILWSQLNQFVTGDRLHSLKEANKREKTTFKGLYPLDQKSLDTSTFESILAKQARNTTIFCS